MFNSLSKNGKKGKLKIEGWHEKWIKYFHMQLMQPKNSRKYNNYTNK
jgi:hypothetical protein